MKVYIYLLVVFLAQANAYHLCSLKGRHGHSGDKAIPIRVFALDFDGTATTLESKDLLQFLYQAKLQNSDKTRKMMAKPWYKPINGKLHSILMDTVGRFKNSPGKFLILRKALAKMDNTVQNFLKSKEVRHYFLKGITVKDIKAIAVSKVQLSPGVNETLQRFQNNSPNIISAGQSKIFDEFVFRKYNAPKNIIIHAGEFVFKNGVSTGKIVGQLAVFDKEKVMAQLIRQHQNINGYSIYVGNDFVDVLAMLTADIGIAINYTPLFIRFIHAAGIATLPVSHWKGECSNRAYLIYTAQSWYEIKKMMFGRHKKKRN